MKKESTRAPRDFKSITLALNRARRERNTRRDGVRACNAPSAFPIRVYQACTMWRMPRILKKRQKSQHFVIRGYMCGDAGRENRKRQAGNVAAQDMNEAREWISGQCATWYGINGQGRSADVNCYVESANGAGGLTERSRRRASG